MEDQNTNNLKIAASSDADETKGSENAELGACKKQAEEYLNNWTRERADFVNYKKDEGKRMGEFIKFANEGLIGEVLDVLDDLDLAVKQVKNAGLEQVIKKFDDLLKKYGAERIAVGVKFDPMLYEVVEGTEGENMEEIRAGYTMHGRVIRPVRVKIIK